MWFNRKSKYDLAEDQYNLQAAVGKFLEEGKHSPDLIQLIRYHFQLVFLPDELQQQMPKHALIKDCSAYLCKAETLSPFIMWKKKLGEESYPIPMRTDRGFLNAHTWCDPKRGDPGAVRGELHAVKPLKFFPLVDKLRQNTVQFQRERVDLMINYRYRAFSLREGWHMSEEKRVFVEAWMYVGKPDYWGEMPLSELGSVRMFIPNNPDKHVVPYYRYTKLEYDDV